MRDGVDVTQFSASFLAETIGYKLRFFFFFKYSVVVVISEIVHALFRPLSNGIM